MSAILGNLAGRRWKRERPSFGATLEAISAVAVGALLGIGFDHGPIWIVLGLVLAASLVVQIRIAVVQSYLLGRIDEAEARDGSEER